MKTIRPNWDRTFLDIAEIVSRRSTCLRLATGAVIVEPTSNRILSTGYNGSPSGTKHCSELGCLMEEGHCIRAVHAEANSLLFGAKKGIALTGAIIYVLHAPCARCSLLIATVGVSEVVYQEEYRDKGGISQLENYGIKVRKALSEDNQFGAVNQRRRRSDNM